MPSFLYQELPVAGVRSLTWKGDGLVDWLRGVETYGLDGSRAAARVHYAYRFDAVVQSPSGDYTVLYERLGTKGIVLRGDQFVREINRSFYHAHAYDYPIALFCLAGGRDALAHCPNHYNQLEIELIETGQRLTPRVEEDGSKPADVFHSGLAVSPDGAWLMSAGWVWHPFLEVSFYPVEAVLAEPSRLDKADGWVAGCAEIASAAFLDAERAVLASSPDAEHFFAAEDDPDMQLRPGMIGVYRPATRSWESRVPFGEPTGKLLGVDGDHALALFEHPKLIHLPTGEVVGRWPEIQSGSWNGCISGQLTDQPPMAWDPGRKRLAIATSDVIHVLTLAEPGLRT